MTDIKKEIKSYVERLFPITRSITGDGNRETLKILSEIVPITVREYTSGTQVFDWVIPDEWKIRDAWIKDKNGNKVVDFSKCNIHIVSYSKPFHGWLYFEELETHLYTHPEIPDAVPYRTAYYKQDWGFCVNRHQYELLQNFKGPFEVFIDSEFIPNGSMTVGELVIPGVVEDEILLSTYICHPSLGNDNLSGMLLTAYLARELIEKKRRRRGLRIIWVPETIGAIAYCAMNHSAMKRIRQGLVITCVAGKDGPWGYKQSFNPFHSINVAIEKVLRNEGIDYTTYPFDIHGSDERQYSSPGLRINVASIHKGKYYEYPFYHTSLDNLNFIEVDVFTKMLNIHMKVLELLDKEPLFERIEPNCEPMLSRHGAYPGTGGGFLPNEGGMNEVDKILWLMFYADGKTGLYEIAKRMGISWNEAMETASFLEEKGLLHIK